MVFGGVYGLFCGVYGRFFVMCVDDFWLYGQVIFRCVFRCVWVIFGVMYGLFLMVFLE